jgi:hypothetical protein
LPQIQEMQRQKSALYFHVPFFSKQSGGHHSLLGKVPSVCFLALPTGKRFRIGLGFGHKILAQTWPKVWVTCGVLCVRMMDRHGTRWLAREQMVTVNDFEVCKC